MEGCESVSLFRVKPFRTAAGFLALLGVPVFGIVLAKIVEIAYGRAKSNSMPCVVGGLTNEKFDELVDFTDKLWRGGGARGSWFLA